MHQHGTRRCTHLSIVLAAIAVLAACDVSPTSPDVGISFTGGCAALTGVFATPTFVVIPNSPGGAIATFTGNPALVLTFGDGRFTANVFAGGLPPITNVGSFSTSGGYVIFGERPLIPRLADGTQRFGCQLIGSRVVLESVGARFDFGTGRFEPATMRAELIRR